MIAADCATEPLASINDVDNNNLVYQVHRINSVDHWSNLSKSFVEFGQNHFKPGLNSI